MFNKIEQEIKELEGWYDKKKNSFATFHGIRELFKAYNDLSEGSQQRPEIFMHPEDLEQYMEWVELMQGENYARLPYFKGVLIQTDVKNFEPPKGTVYLKNGFVRQNVTISFGEKMNEATKQEGGIYANEIHVSAGSASVSIKPGTDASDVLVFIPTSPHGARDLIEQYKRSINEIETVFGFDKTNFT